MGELSQNIGWQDGVTPSVLITGASGFIGFHVALRLASLGIPTVGVDSFLPYYDPTLKESRAEILDKRGIHIHRICVEDTPSIRSIVQHHNISHIIHLAAQAGVRHSLKDPWSYIRSNIDGFLSLLEVCRAFPHIRTVWASSSSVYGLNEKTPFSEEDRTDVPANLYGATKKSNELMAHAYHHLFGLQLIALRFFTVYGPWGRPDMAYYSFAEKILRSEPIELFGKEELRRDFTYIDDIVDGIYRALFVSDVPYGTYNLGGSHPESVLSLVSYLEKYLGKQAILRFCERPKGDIQTTYADTDLARKELGFQAKVSLSEGIQQFCEWYLPFFTERERGIQ